MKLNYDRKSKDPTYFIQQGRRNGTKTTTSNVKRIGKHSELLAITSDPLQYAKEQVIKFNEEYKKGITEVEYTVDFNEKLPYTENITSKSTAKNIGYFFLQQIYHELRIYDFFKPLQEKSKATYDFNTINRFLTFARILDPKSKYGTYDSLNTYFEEPNYAYKHSMLFLDKLEDNYDKYIEHLFVNSNNIVKRDTKVCYYDCSNFYFEIEDEDEDYVDPVTGEVFSGLRQYGYSKDHKPNPIAGMGLFMDGQGLPISMNIHVGNRNEQTTAIPLEKKIVQMFKGKPFIYCADAGLGSFNIRTFNSMGGRAFVVTQSIKNLSDTLQQAVFNDYDYRRLSDDSTISIEHMKEFDKYDENNLSLYDDKAYKVLFADKAIDLGLKEEKLLLNGKTKMVKAYGNLEQRVIITFSRKAMEYQRHVRNGQIERARSLVNEKRVEDVKKGPNDVKRFIKRTSKGENGEPAIDHYYIDESVIEREEKYDGFYAIATNLDDDVREILRINAMRYKIEECFRILKSILKARPAYCSNPDHIIAHFLICYTALLIYRLLEVKLDEYGTHFTTKEIIDTLKNMGVINVKDKYYQSAYTSSKVCTALNGIYDLGLDKQNYEPKELRKKIKKISK